MSYNYSCKIVWYAANAGAKLNPRELLAEQHPELFVDWPDGHWTDWLCWIDGELRQVLVYENSYLPGWRDEEFEPTARLRLVAEEPPPGLDSEMILLGEDWDDYEASTNFGRPSLGGMHLLSAERQIILSTGVGPKENSHE